MGIIAELRGKLSQEATNHDRLEDLLTSNVFQLLRYLPPELGYLPVLQQAVNMFNKSLIVPNSQNTWVLNFWPYYKGCEPDLEIKVYSSTQDLLAHYFVEAKYLSPKSGEAKKDEDGFYVAGSDQLERQWSLLRDMTKANHFAIIYLTAHQVLPRSDLKISAESALDSDQATESIYWLSWQGIGQVLASVKLIAPISIAVHYVLQDIIDLLDKKGLKHFSGWGNIRHCSNTTDLRFYYPWPLGLWNTPCANVKLKWRFQTNGKQAKL